MSNSLTTAWLWTGVEIVLYIICACLPGVYAYLKTALSHKQQLNSRPTDRSRTTLKTIGNIPSMHKQIQAEFEDYESRTMLDGSRYEVICEPETEGDGYSMRPLEPVRIRRDFEVTSV
ncbi:hypothetical protein RRF57_001977 [Xylaria bambusicola]|uniref:Uncharacterized protein n=1 Tax=Xylaria bambusicola TaxID=326684 RepID=A0AAN7UEL2_9PEZI